MCTKEKIENSSKERWFNYRPLCVMIIFLVLGCLFAYYVTRATVISIIIGILILLSLILVTVIYRKVKYILLPILYFIFGLSAYYIVVLSFQSKLIEKPNNIVARIYSTDNYDDGKVRLYADSCIFDSKKVNERITIYVYDNDNIFKDIEVGSIISFTPKNFYHNDLFTNEIPSANLLGSNMRYTATVGIDDITYKRTDFTFAEKIKNYIKHNLSNALTNENVEIAYSALFGDKTNLNDMQYSAYKLSGVAHLLAVSGLHVGIITAILYKLLDLLKIKRWGRVVIVAIFLFIYMYICNFSVSVVRATIMSLVMLMSPLLFRQYDSLSAISLAGIIVFIVNPLCIFDISTLMSFSCAYGITLLYKPISRVLSKTRIPKVVVDSLSISIATMISLMLVMAYFFKSINLISIIANIILIPIFTIGFSFIFALSMLSLILPFITYLLVIVNPLFDFIALLAGVFGNLPFANFATVDFKYIGIIVYFAIILITSRICVAKTKDKVILTLPLLALLIVCLL